MIKRIRYNGEVGEKLITYMLDLLEYVHKSKPEQVIFYFSSQGGDAGALPVLKDIVKDLCNLTDMVIVNYDEVNSAGVNFFMMFDKRKANIESTFLIHQSSYDFEGDTADFILKYVKEGKKHDEQWLSEFLTYCMSYGMSENEAKKIKRLVKYGVDYIIFEKEARRFGIVS